MDVWREGGGFKIQMSSEGGDQTSAGCPMRGRGDIFNFFQVGGDGSSLEPNKIEGALYDELLAMH